MSAAPDPFLRRPARVPRLMAALEGLAAQGRALAHVEHDLAPLVGESGYVVRELICRARRQGLIRLHHEGRLIAAIEAGDGAWRVPVAGPAVAQRAEAAERRCLRCREDFRPEHRGRFLCDPCNTYAQANG